MKVLAFGASNSQNSINKQLAYFTALQIDNADITLLDLNDFEMPIYSADRERDSGIPEQAQTFFKKISEADTIVISFAEHNGSYTAAYKNIFDWMSRIDMKVYQGKSVILLATSPGPGGAQSVLNSAVSSASFFAMNVKGTLSVPSFYDNFDAEKGEITNLELIDQIKSITATL